MSSHKDGDRIEMADVMYKYHEKHGCMEIVEHYRMETVTLTPCPECGHVKKAQKKVLLP